MRDCFFDEFVAKVARVVEELPDDAFIEVKKVRRAMGVPSKNKSKTAFISRALMQLCDDGCLEYQGKIGGAGTRKYKKRNDA